MTDRHIGIVGIMMASIIAGGVAGWWLKPCPTPKVDPQGSTVEIRIDSIPYPVYYPKIVYRDLRSTKIVYRDTGTKYEMPAFTATLDTVMGKDSLSLSYDHPEDRFSLVFLRKPDSIMVPEKTILVTTTVYEQRPWWQDALIVVGSGTIGYAIGSVTR